ncbi:MAG: isoprenylcysteine carboxylmethyltransferase family protein [Acidobacteria bacterium]|nr:isoprenylcysteine carboxylmethyltransferase family protein [Acidobacteriota bacterium]
MRHLKTILILPTTATVIIPATILWFTGGPDFGWSLGWSTAFPVSLALLLAGCALICAGLTLLGKTIHLFATIGKGTLAPWDPTQKLVVQGPYRHVRNPMISGVWCILLGESVLLGSVPVFIFALLFVTINHVYFITSEEPGLMRRFGEEYLLYRNAVPRWVPRLTPWEKEVSE